MELKKITNYVKIPFLITAARCGKGNPFSDGVDMADVPEEFVKNISAPSYVVASGDSMEPIINSGDILILDTNISPRHKDIVLVCYQGEYIVKSFFVNNFSSYLLSINKEYKPIKLSSYEDYQIIGVVKKILRDVDRNTINISLKDYPNPILNNN